MTIELAPELESDVAKYAAAKGIQPSAFVERAVEDALTLERSRQVPEKKEDISVFLDRLASIAKPVNALATETFSREMIYADLDEKFRF